MRDPTSDESADDAVIASLSTLKPAAPADAAALAIAFEAGRRSMRSSVRRWRMIASTLAIGVVAILMLPNDPAPPRTPIALTTRPPVLPVSPRSVEPLDSSSVIAMRSVLLAGGVQELPRPRGVPLGAAFNHFNPY